MNFNAVKQNGRAETSAEIDVQTADDAGALFKSSVCDANIWRNRQTGFAFQVFARRRVERLSARRADAVAARADNYRRTRFRFGQRDEVGERRNFSRQRIVFDADREARAKLIRQSVAPLGAVNLVRHEARAECPAHLIFLSRPAHGATFARSERSARNARRFCL